MYTNGNLKEFYWNNKSQKYPFWDVDCQYHYRFNVKTSGIFWFKSVQTFQKTTVICLFRDVRRRETAQIQLNVFGNLLVAYILFLFGIRQVHYTYLCNAITILMQYTFLASWFWIAVYSNKLYFSLVKVSCFVTNIDQKVCLKLSRLQNITMYICKKMRYHVYMYHLHLCLAYISKKNLNRHISSLSCNLWFVIWPGFWEKGVLLPKLEMKKCFKFLLHCDKRKLRLRFITTFSYFRCFTWARKITSSKHICLRTAYLFSSCPHMHSLHCYTWMTFFSLKLFSTQTVINFCGHF